MKYRKKPVIIEAEQFLPKLQQIGFWGFPIMNDDKGPFLSIPTLEGNMICKPMDWLIRGVKDEIYPCKPDIFEITYELVESAEI